jgi:hypothetical protein
VPGAVAEAYNLGYSGDWDQEDHPRQRVW